MCVLFCVFFGISFWVACNLEHLLVLELFFGAKQLKLNFLVFRSIGFGAFLLGLPPGGAPYTHDCGPRGTFMALAPIMVLFG